VEHAHSWAYIAVLSGLSKNGYQAQKLANIAAFGGNTTLIYELSIFDLFLFRDADRNPELFSNGSGFAPIDVNFSAKLYLLRY
jgi:hypothetical protein